MVVPSDMPVTTPVLPIVATDVVLLLHTPPNVASVRVVVVPAQIVVVPAMDDTEGKVPTVKVVVAVAEPQAPVTEYEIIEAPSDMAVTAPVLPIVATAGLLLLHVPPLVASVSVVVPPAHSVVMPVITPADTALTVMVLVAVAVPQTFVTVYKITSIPVLTPVTTPILLMPATVGELLLHTPEAAVSDNVIVTPVHTDVAPVMYPA